ESLAGRRNSKAKRPTQELARSAETSPAPANHWSAFLRSIRPSLLAQAALTGSRAEQVLPPLLPAVGCKRPTLWWRGESPSRSERLRYGTWSGFLAGLGAFERFERL